MRNRMLATLVLTLFAGAAPAAAQESEYGACADRSDLEAQRQSCTDMIGRADITDALRGGAYLYRCQANDLLNRLGDALADCQEAERLRDWDPSVHNSLSIVHANLGNAGEAVSAATRAVTLEPDNAIFVNTRANAFCRLGNVDASIGDRLRAMELGRFTATSMQEWLRQTGHYTGAIDGVFGRGSRAALRAWTVDGCP